LEVEGQLFVAEAVHLSDDGGPQGLLAGHASASSLRRHAIGHESLRRQLGQPRVLVEEGTDGLQLFGMLLRQPGLLQRELFLAVLAQARFSFSGETRVVSRGLQLWVYTDNPKMSTGLAQDSSRDPARYAFQDGNCLT